MSPLLNFTLLKCELQGPYRPRRGGKKIATYSTSPFFLCDTNYSSFRKPPPSNLSKVNLASIVSLQSTLMMET